MVKYNAQIIAYGKSNSLFSPLSVDGCSNTLSSKRRANQHVNVCFPGTGTHVFSYYRGSYNTLSEKC